MRVTNIYLKYDGPFACDTADIARALAVVDASQRTGLIWYSQEWEVAGIQQEVLELAGDEHNEWYTRLQNECVRLGDVAAAQRAMRGIGQIIWGRLLGFVNEPTPGFCADLWDVEWERIPVDPPLVCAIQMMDSADVGIVTCDRAVVEAMERMDMVKTRSTYKVE